MCQTLEGSATFCYYSAEVQNVLRTMNTLALKCQFCTISHSQSLIFFNRFDVKEKEKPLHSYTEILSNLQLLSINSLLPQVWSNQRVSSQHGASLGVS